MWADNRFPAWFTIVALTLVVVVAVVRIALVRSSTAERLINRILFLAMVTALLREPAIAERLAPFVPGGLPMLFDIWHAVFLVACSLFVGLFLLWDRGIAKYQQPMRRTVGVACVVGALLLILGEPARNEGLNVADAGGWRYGLYFVAYAGLLFAFCLDNLPSVLTLGARTASAKDTAAVVVLFLMLFNGALIMSLMAVGNVLGAAGLDNTYTRLAYLGASGELLLLWVVLGAAVLVPSAVRAVVQLLRLDPDSLAARRMYPVWRDLTAAAPGVVLALKPSDRFGASSAERLHRRRVEILDAAAIVGLHAVPVPEAVDELIEVSGDSEDEQEALRSVLELASASWRLHAIGGAHRAGRPPLGHYHVPDIDTLARLWKSAQELMDRAHSQGLLSTAGRLR